MTAKDQFWGRGLYNFIYTLGLIFHRLYYRKFTAVGVEKIPAGTPVIFAPNHQNALMDPLAVMYATRKTAGFLARADIFKNPKIAKLLNLIRILPIYRIRDGFESLARNQEVFENTVAVLKSNLPICILPEGNHDGHKRLRPLKKGIFRIAFKAEESTDFNMNLHIIPVGIDYSDYFSAGSDLLVVFGTPIKVSDYKELYRENEQKTINKLMNMLAEGMKSVMLNIPEANYDLILKASEMYEPNIWNTTKSDRHPFNKFTIKQYLVQKLVDAFTQFPGKAVELQNSMDTYLNNLSGIKLPDCLIQEKPPRLFTLVLETILSFLLLPFHCYGLIVNYIPFKVPILAAAKIKDKHFKSSIHFGVGMLFFPVYYIIIVTIFSLIFGGIIPVLAFALSLPISALFAFYNFQHMKNLLVRYRVFFLFLSKPLQYQAIFNEKMKLTDQIKSIINS